MTPGRDAKALLRVHRAFLLLLAVFVPLAIHFAWHLDIATLGDDSVSYLALASYYSGHVSDPLLARWTWWSAHFPPLFPLLLAATGAWRDLLVAHLLVALCSVAGFILAYRLALLVLEEADAALGVAFLFAVTPSAWVNTLGVMSDPLYLASMGMPDLVRSSQGLMVGDYSSADVIPSGPNAGRSISAFAVGVTDKTLNQGMYVSPKGLAISGGSAAAQNASPAAVKQAESLPVQRQPNVPPHTRLPLPSVP